MEAFISIRSAAKKLGCDKSALLKRLKREGYRIGKTYDGGEAARGQKVSVIRLVDFEELAKLRKSVQW